MSEKTKRVGILVGGGDAPGVNAAIRGAVYRAADAGMEVIGLWDGWAGLFEESLEHAWKLDRAESRTWYRDGGSVVGASRTNPFRFPQGTRILDRSGEVLRSIERLELDGVIALGGEDTLGVARRLAEAGAPVVGVPKTIARDLSATEYTIGYDTALRTASEFIERARTPAGSHHWVQVVEVMGRYAGHLALWAGWAGGASIVLIPEHPFDFATFVRRLNERLHPEHRDRRYPRYALVVVAEGAHPVGVAPITLDDERDAFGRPKLGGVGAYLAERIRKETEHDARSLALGHAQRGGAPSHVDRAMGWMFGVAAVEATQMQRWGHMVAAHGCVPECQVRLVTLADAVAQLSLVDVPRYYDTERFQVTRQFLGGGLR